MPPIAVLKTKHWPFTTSLSWPLEHMHWATRSPWMRLMLSSSSKQALPQASNKLGYGPEICQGDNWKGKREETLEAFSDTKTSGADDSSQHSFFYPHTHTLYPCQALSSNPNNPSIVEKSNSALHYVTFIGLGALWNIYRTDDWSFHPLHLHLNYCIYLVFPNIQAQSQGAITFKVVPGVKEEAPTKEPKVGVVLGNEKREYSNEALTRAGYWNVSILMQRCYLSFVPKTNLRYRTLRNVLLQNLFLSV